MGGITGEREESKMELLNIIAVIGVLLIVNGIFLTQKQYQTAKVDKEMRAADEDIICGNYKGLLGLNDTQIWLSTNRKGVISRACAVRAGMFRMAKIQEVDLCGEDIHTMDTTVLNLSENIRRACRVAQVNNERFERRQKRKCK